MSVVHAIYARPTTIYKILTMEVNKMTYNSPSESYVENKVVKYAKDKGVGCEKFELIAKGCPDRIFFYNGRCVFVEFKTFFNWLTHSQSVKKKAYESCGMSYFVCRSFDGGKRIVNALINDIIPFVDDTAYFYYKSAVDSYKAGNTTHVPIRRSKMLILQ